VSVLQFIVALAAAVVAPVALYFQQRQQNAREMAREDRQRLERQAEADRTAAERNTGERRDAYLRALRAVSVFRASIASPMVKIAAAAWDDKRGATMGPPMATKDLWAAPGPSVPKAEYGAALEAVAEARLWVRSEPMRQAVDSLRDALELAVSPLTRTSQLVTEAAEIGDMLTTATERFAEAAHADLEPARTAS
jgi:hypothetical protein